MSIPPPTLKITGVGTLTLESWSVWLALGKPKDGTVIRVSAA